MIGRIVIILMTGADDGEFVPCGFEKNTFCCRGDPCFNETQWGQGDNDPCMRGKKPYLSFVKDILPLTTIGVARSTAWSDVISTTKASTLTSASSTRLGDSGKTATATTGSVTTNAPSDEPAPKSSKSTTRLGLAVGIPVGVVLIGAVLAAFWWRERRHRREISQLQGHPASPGQTASHPHGFEEYAPTYPTMGFAPHELDRSRHDWSSRVAEAPGTSRLPHEIMSADSEKEPAVSRSRHEIVGDEPVAHELPGRRLTPLPGKADDVSVS